MTSLISDSSEISKFRSRNTKHFEIVRFFFENKISTFDYILLKDFNGETEFRSKIDISSKISNDNKFIESLELNSSRYFLLQN